MNKIVRGIKAVAEANRHAVAVISAGRTLTYFDLCRLIAILSNHFARRGIAKGSKVFLNFADVDLKLATAIACIHYGLIPFINSVIGDLREAMDFDLVIADPNGPDPTVPADILIDDALLKASDISTDLKDFGDPADDDILFIASTTGTTGAPKLVAETYGAFRGRGGPIEGWIRPNSDGLGQGSDGRPDHRRVLITLGDSSKYAFGMNLRLLATGATIVRARSNALDLFRATELYDVTHILTTPSTMALLLRQMEQEDLRCPGVRSLHLTGALIQPSVLAEIEARFDAEIGVTYGSAEVGGISSGVIKSSTFTNGYVGELNQGVTMVSAGTKAEPRPVTIVNTPGILATYYSKGKLIRNTAPFYSLPDLGYLIGTSLYVVGRDDEVFNWGGEKIAFSLIEAFLRQTPGIADVGIVRATAIGDPNGVVIALVARPDVDFDRLKERLCHFVKAIDAGPSLHLVRLSEIARNATGKVDRQRVIEAKSGWRIAVGNDGRCLGGRNGEA